MHRLRNQLMFCKPQMKQKQVSKVKFGLLALLFVFMLPKCKNSFLRAGNNNRRGLQKQSVTMTGN